MIETSFTLKEKRREISLLYSQALGTCAKGDPDPSISFIYKFYIDILELKFFKVF